MNSTVDIYVNRAGCPTENSHFPVFSDSVIILTVRNNIQKNKKGQVGKGTALLDQLRSVSLSAHNYQFFFTD